jgi:hypothetical protein
MSNLADRSEAREAEHINLFGDTIDRWSDKEYFEGGPAYPSLGNAVAKHRRLDDTSYDGQKAYGQAVNAAIRALQRRELFSAAYDRASLPRDVGAMSDAQFMAMIRAQAKAGPARDSRPAYRYDEKAEHAYYRAMLESRGVDVGKLETIWFDKNHRARGSLALWLKDAWNVIKTKRGTPYLVEAKPAPAPAPEATVAPVQPKKRGRPFGSKNKPKPVAVVTVAEPKPSKPRVPSHYLSSASRVAYHAAM